MPVLVLSILLIQLSLRNRLLIIVVSRPMEIKGSHDSKRNWCIAHNIVVTY